jgi:His-Xaa-Ser system protein HxsD
MADQRTGSVDTVAVEPDHARVTAAFPRSLYPLDAIYGAAYIFIDRCYVYLDAPDADRVQVSLVGRSELSEAELKALAGEFANELLSQAWRHEITEANRPILEAVAAQALIGAAGPPGLDDLEDMDFSEETFEDPLGIAMSWEEKYGKTPAEPPKEGAPPGLPPEAPSQAVPEGGSPEDGAEAKEAEAKKASEG